jgi:hypothetical protein
MQFVKKNGLVCMVVDGHLIPTTFATIGDALRSLDG